MNKSNMFWALADDALTYNESETEENAKTVTTKDKVIPIKQIQ